MDVDEDTILTPPRILTNIPVGIDTDTIIRYRTATFEPEAPVMPTFVETGPLEATEHGTPQALVEPSVRPSRLSPDEVAAAVETAVTTQPPARDDLRETVPVDYSFRINQMDAVLLDVPTLIGRRPALPRIMRGSPPKLLTVASPRNEVSATHLELRQQGALVIVTDLRSTNGSVVRMPGRPPIKLGQGESVVVSPGTVVDIGDGNVVEVLPLQRGESGATAEIAPTRAMPATEGGRSQ